MMSNPQNSDIVVVAKEGGFTFIGTIIARGLNYAYLAVLIWGLGAEEFGFFILALTITTFIGVLAQSGLDLGIVRFGAIHAQNPGKISIHKTTMIAVRISLSLGFLFLLVLLISSNTIAEIFFHKPQLAPIIRILALAVPLIAVQTLLLAATRAFKIMKYSVYVLVIQPFAALIFAIPLLVLHKGIEAIAYSLVISYLLGGCFSIFFYRRVISHQDKSSEPVPTRQIIRFSIPLSMTQWIHFANERTEVIFLGMLPGAVNVGIYKIAWSLAALETVLRLSLEQILAPYSSDLSNRKEIKQLESLYKTTAKWSFTGALLLFVIYTLFAKEIMMVFDPVYVAGAGVLITLALAQLFNEFTGACGTVLTMSGRSDLSLLNTITLFISSITLDLLLIPRFGLAGATLAGALSIILVNTMRVVEVWLTLKIHPIKWSFLKPVIAGLLSVTSVILLRTYLYSGTLLINIVYGIFAITFYISIILFLGLDSEDMIVIRAATRKMSGFKGNLRGEA